MQRLTGRRVLVTGAARGLGEAIVRQAVAEGAAVAALDVDATAARQLADELTSSGSHVVGIGCDLTGAEQCANAVAEAAAALGGLDSLVNNAGIIREGMIDEIDEADWRRTLDVNLTAPWRLTRLVVPHFEAAGGGSIVNMSSIESERVHPGHAAYSTSKAGVLQLTRATAVDLGPRNIRANAVCPGPIETDMLRQTLDGATDPAVARANLLSRLRLGRLGRPDEVAVAVVHLLSDEAGFTTGNAYVIDGARSIGL